MSTREEYHEMKGDKTFGKDDCPLCQVVKNNENISEICGGINDFL